MLINLDNQTDLSIPLDILEQIASNFTTREIELIVTDAKNIQDINSSYRGKDSPTDVLSFPIDGDFMPLGSIVICDDFVYKKANLLGHTQSEEFTLLFIHGMLHLLGFDHEVDSGEMRDKEEEIIKEFSLPKSLIVRTEN
jgi:probable rRNA maturation factor